MGTISLRSVLSSYSHGLTSVSALARSLQLDWPPPPTISLLPLLQEVIASRIPPEQWDVVVLNQVQVDNVRNLTYVAWEQPLNHESGETSLGWSVAKVFALRQKAALFGNNAPDPNLFVNNNASPPTTSFPNLVDTTSTPWEWKNFEVASASQIDLDASYPKVVAGGWFALTQKGVAQLYGVQEATVVSRADFGLSAKVTELSADYADPTIGSVFQLRPTQVWAQSDELTIAEQPLTYPLYGTHLDLADLRPDLLGTTAVALTGTRQKIAVADGVTNLSFVPDDGSGTTTLKPGDVLTVTNPAPLPPPNPADGSFPDWSSSAVQLTLNVEDAAGRQGTIQQTSLSNFVLAPSAASDPQVTEYALVSLIQPVNAGYPHTQIQLQSSLTNCYDRNTTTVNANVGLATAGQSVSEITGSGSASTPNQSFTLKQWPVTYIQAPTPTGRQSTLQVAVNGVNWTEVPTLYQQPPSATVYATLTGSDTKTEVIFGDGVEGATLPTGQNNVQPNYRIGSGSAGNIAAGALTTLVDRPLGVSGVTNPQPATGGQDPQSITDVRSNAPQTVLTLGRAVSITDYQSYAATFAGIAKAYAIWIPAGPSRGVFLTVAGVNGADLTGSPTLANLVASLQNFGNPLIPITVLSFLETLFGLSADVLYDPAYDRPTVNAQVQQTLAQTYSFANRSFGQGVLADELRL